MMEQVTYGDLEIDKIPSAWVMTWWLPDDVTLRLKLEHTCADEPDECVAQVRLRPDEEFQTVHEFLTCGLVDQEEFRDVGEVLANGGWTREFMTMLEVWGRLTRLVEFGETGATRYASEPQSSRDHFMSDPAPVTEAGQP